MGVIRFLIPPQVVPPEWSEVYRAYICGLDQSVHPTRIEFDGQVMSCRRQTSESGKMHVAWDVRGYGRPVIGTASLPEREQPYLLPLELARGKIVQVRNQLANWQGWGLQPGPEFDREYSRAHALFAQAVAAQASPEVACTQAQQALEHIFRAAELLTQLYAQESLANRHRRYAQVPTLLGCEFGPAAQSAPLSGAYLEAFNAALVPIEWRRVEPDEGRYSWDQLDQHVDWCLSHRLVTHAGPLLDLSPNGLPSWLWPWEHDIWNLQSFACDFVETAMRRYLGRIRIWEVSARVNSGGALALTEEHRLALVAKSLEVARNVDEEAQLFIRLDQPWAEYQARGQHKLSPLHFADALVRAGLGLSGVNLEIAVGYRPRGSLSRDLLEFSRLLDLWSTLGIPILVTLSCPSSKGTSLRCQSDLEAEPEFWRGAASEEQQAQWIDHYVPLLLAKPAVVGVFWAHFSDGEPHVFPHGGLVRTDGSPKPGLARIAHLRTHELH